MKDRIKTIYNKNLLNVILITFIISLFCNSFSNNSIYSYYDDNDDNFSINKISIKAFFQFKKNFNKLLNTDLFITASSIILSCILIFSSYFTDIIKSPQKYKFSGIIRSPPLF